MGEYTVMQRRQPVRAIMKIYSQQEKNQGEVREIRKRDPAWMKFRQEEEGRGGLLGGWEDLREKYRRWPEGPTAALTSTWKVFPSYQVI